MIHADGARLVERRLAKSEATGSIPVIRSKCACGRMVRRQPSKLSHGGSIPFTRSAGQAEMALRCLGKAETSGSSPETGSGLEVADG